MLSITALYVGILALFFIGLSFAVIAQRTKHKTFIGDGAQADIEVFVRIHGNFAEYIPFALLLMAVYEINQGEALYLHTCGVALIVSRILHAIGLLYKSNGASVYRMLGVHLVFWPMAVLAVLNINYYF